MLSAHSQSVQQNRDEILEFLRKEFGQRKVAPDWRKSIEQVADRDGKVCQGVRQGENSIFCSHCSISHLIMAKPYNCAEQE